MLEKKNNFPLITDLFSLKLHRNIAFMALIVKDKTWRSYLSDMSKKYKVGFVSVRDVSNMAATSFPLSASYEKAELSREFQVDSSSVQPRTQRKAT